MFIIKLIEIPDQARNDEEAISLIIRKEKSLSRILERLFI
jgi:hypothetical protein